MRRIDRILKRCDQGQDEAVDSSEDSAHEVDEAFIHKSLTNLYISRFYFFCLLNILASILVQLYVL